MGRRARGKSFAEECPELADEMAVFEKADELEEAKRKAARLTVKQWNLLREAARAPEGEVQVGPLAVVRVAWALTGINLGEYFPPSGKGNPATFAINGKGRGLVASAEDLRAKAADPALTAYEAFASIYNDFNASNDYEMWLGQALLPELRKHGLREGGRALDVGCGTGRAFRALQSRGWRIKGCDLSPAMLEVAAQDGGAKVSLQIADMRNLPRLGKFDLVLSLNDSVNYLLGDDDLVLALAGMRTNLAKGGLMIFDVNSRSTYESGAAEVKVVEHEGSRWVWSGRGEISPSVYEAEIAGDRLIEPIRHLERFRSHLEVMDAMRAADLQVVAALGMSEASGEVLLTEPLDETRDYKLVFIGAASR